MNDADRASEALERELEAAIKAARGIPAKKGQTVCRYCSGLLTPIRQEFGCCIDCAKQREKYGE